MYRLSFPTITSLFIALRSLLSASVMSAGEQLLVNSCCLPLDNPGGASWERGQKILWST
jgi:hypothetical protein